jgi:hypothetical protein
MTRRASRPATAGTRTPPDVTSTSITASSRWGERGFSGSGAWSADYDAVVAIVSHASPAQRDSEAAPARATAAPSPSTKLTNASQVRT